MTLLPPAPGKCQECAVDHEPDQPHNAQSLFYQYHFRGKQGRWPTWADAVAHCAPEVQAAWKEALQERGAWTEPAEHQAPDVLPTDDGRIGTMTIIEVDHEGVGE